jgi:hypothetical protein
MPKIHKIIYNVFICNTFSSTIIILTTDFIYIFIPHNSYLFDFKIITLSQAWWCTPVIQEVKAGGLKLEASLTT